VIVSDAAPGLLDLVKNGQTGLVVPVEDPAALAKAIELLANNANLRKRLGDAARLRVSEYELSKVMAIWEPIILADPKTHRATARVAGRHGHALQPGPTEMA
jgi:glycosyltransferase involved in cell wall biosynthesis